MNTQTFNNMWDAIEDTPQQAANMQAKSTLMMELEHLIVKQNITKLEAARLFGVTQPRIAELLQGRINLFSLDALMNMATTAGLCPRIVIEPQNITTVKVHGTSVRPEVM